MLSVLSGGLVVVVVLSLVAFMHGRTPMVPGPTWWFRLYTAWVGVVFTLAAVACFIDRDEWFSAHSVAVFRDLTSVPWPAWGLAFIAVPIGLCHPRTRLYAWAVGFVISVGVVATLWIFTVADHQIINILVLLLALIIPLALLAGVRYCVMAEKADASE